MPRGDIKMSYYLQYGTAIMDRSFDRRVDSTRLEGQAKLKGWRMDFSREAGQPNLVQDAASHVWGLLFLVEEQKLNELDKAEQGGTRQKLSVLFEGEPEEAYVYTYPKSSEQPNAEFLKNFREVYRQASLPQKQIDQALGLVASK
jgi:gamma-glutamylcyclotransferase (GGCT)/AIG2-like uncharacterized protein YtfP